MSESKMKLSTSQMALTALMTACICVMGPWALNLPFSPVPISLCSMAIYFALYVLGLKLGIISVALYILLGAAGIPVFSNFSAGLGKIAGPTGGYIIGYLFLALICGLFIHFFPNRLPLHVVGFVLGTLVLYLFGTLWLQYQLKLSFSAALAAGVIPYIPGDIVKLIIALTVGYPLKKRLVKAGLL